MGKFKVGDRVTRGDSHATVLNTDSIEIQWDSGAFGTWPESDFELEQRKFKEGDFARVVGADPEYAGRVVFIFEDDNDPEDEEPYWTVFTAEDLGEVPFSADELIPWSPLVGARVVEPEEEDEVGTVIGWANSVTARVLWDSFPHAQDWLVSDLEPAFEDEDDSFETGDDVVYTNGPGLSYRTAVTPKIFSAGR